MPTVRLTIEGQVQGVGFRWFARERARTLGVTGTARNRPTGTVEIEATGERAALEAFVEAMRQGPRGARVSHVEEHWVDRPAEYRDFTITS